MLSPRCSDGGDLLEDEAALPRRGPGSVVRELWRGRLEDRVLGEGGGRGAVLVVVPRGLDVAGHSLALAAHHHGAGPRPTPAGPGRGRKDVSEAEGRMQILS